MKDMNNCIAENLESFLTELREEVIKGLRECMRNENLAREIV